MKVIIKHNLLEDTLTILNIHTVRNKCIDSIMRDIRDMQTLEEDEYRVMIHDRNEIHLYQRGLIYGKTLIARYVVDEYHKDIFNGVVKELNEENEDNEDNENEEY